MSQILFFGLFAYLVYVTAYPLRPGIPADLFLRLDPLLALTSAISGRSFVFDTAVSLIVVGLTILLGRVFCGWICPLGTVLDTSDVFFFRGRRETGGRRLYRLKYYVLAAVIVSSLFAVQVAYFFDPLSLLTRTVVLSFIAPIQLVVQWLSGVFYGWSLSSFGPLSSIGGWLSDRMAGWQFVAGPRLFFSQALVTIIIFAVIVGLNNLSRRFWCRNLCPLGALLGLLSRATVLKRSVNDKCVDCGKCIRDCKMSAIPENPRLTHAHECIVCMNCVSICPPSAVSFRLRLGLEFHDETRLNLSRRRLIQSAAVGLGFTAMVKIDPSRKHALSGTSPIQLGSAHLIRPPGSLPEHEFTDRCIRCGACMKVCPTNGLQPVFQEAGLEGFWTPVLVPRIGCCTQECNACGQVCPTNAIRPFRIEEKSHIFIGTAVIDRSQCMVWNAGKKCLVCDEYCSYRAIEWVEENGFQRPTVNEKICVGCGICESACPIQPVAAIRVYSFGDKRHMSRTEQKQWRDSAFR